MSAWLTIYCCVWIVNIQSVISIGIFDESLDKGIIQTINCNAHCSQFRRSIWMNGILCTIIHNFNLAVNTVCHSRHRFSCHSCHYFTFDGSTHISYYSTYSQFYGIFHRLTETDSFYCYLFCFIFRSCYSVCITYVLISFWWVCFLFYLQFIFDTLKLQISNFYLLKEWYIIFLKQNCFEHNNWVIMCISPWKN